MSQSRQPLANDATRVVRQSLEALERSGVTHLRKPRGTTVAAASAAASSAAQSGPVEPEVASPQPAAPPPAAPRAADAPAAAQSPHSTDRLSQLDVIRREVAACTRCDELATTRHLTVFGSGNPQPRLVFMGEAPGADEDRQGLPFVGRAGQLLTKIIEACTLRREDVYILNTLKCRPPNNRAPLPQEAANCRGFLDRQLATLQPEFICCLGAVAAQNLLGTTQTIGRLRGEFHQYQGIRVLCTYHPAYLLRNPAAKKDCWQDMQLLMREMGIPLAVPPASSGRGPG